LHIYSQYITNISISHGTKTNPKAKEKTQKRKTKTFSEKVNKCLIINKNSGAMLWNY